MDFKIKSRFLKLKTTECFNLLVLNKYYFALFLYRNLYSSYPFWYILATLILQLNSILLLNLIL